MPHIVIEHSPRLDASHDLQALCDALWDTFATHPNITAPDTVRVRTIASTASRIGVEPQSFAHATLLLLPGRDEETRRGLAELILNTLDEFLPDVGSLTVRVDHLEQPYIKRMLAPVEDVAHG
ncbi:MAG: 5-carboxymethyl-2-hydroxymuconate isomerase [Pseudomonadota bacterium]